MPIEDPLAWAVWHEDSIEQRRVAYTTIRADVHVSTVFLGTDMNFFGESDAALLYETMVFGGDFDSLCERSQTLEQAEDVHERVVRQVCRLMGVLL